MDCPRCRMVRYCSKRCQKADWTVGKREERGNVTHKVSCAVLCKVFAQAPLNQPFISNTLEFDSHIQIT